MVLEPLTFSFMLNTRLQTLMQIDSFTETKLFCYKFALCCYCYCVYSNHVISLRLSSELVSIFFPEMLKITSARKTASVGYE